MITDTTVSLYKRTETTNSRGQVVNTYALYKSFQANIQPIGRDTVQSKQWGNTDLNANDRLMFFYPDTSVSELDRIVDAWGKTYEVRNINPWGSPPFGHFEAVLKPVQGL